MDRREDEAADFGDFYARDLQRCQSSAVSKSTSCFWRLSDGLGQNFGGTESDEDHEAPSAPSGALGRVKRRNGFIHRASAEFASFFFFFFSEQRGLKSRACGGIAHWMWSFLLYY